MSVFIYFREEEHANDIRHPWPEVIPCSEANFNLTQARRPDFITILILNIFNNPQIIKPTYTMTRSHKFNDRDHAGLADGTASIEEHLPRYFSKSGHEGVDPKKVKKEGSGKSNWGRPGEESDDYDFKFTNARRRSNSSSNGHGLSAFKTKFETVDQDPVFEEELHGAPAEEEHLALDKEESADSISSASIDEEDHAKKV